MESTPSLSPKTLRLIFIGFLLLYFAIGLTGYSADSDAYRMIRTGQNLLLTGRYRPSRYPGYLLPEIVIGAASLAGGHVLSNLISALLAAAALYLFFQLLRKPLGDHQALLAAAVIGLNPFFLIAASSSMDYVYSLFFILAGVYALTARKVWLAAVLLAAAVSSRLGNALLVASIYLYFLYSAYRAGKPAFTRRLLSAIAAAGLTALLYLPIYRSAKDSFRFLTYDIGDWDWFGYLSRFVYKNVFVWGLLPFALLALTGIYSLYKSRKALTMNPAVLAGVGIWIVHELVFLKVPLAMFYLLPVLFIVLPLWFLLVDSKKLAVLLLVFTLTYNFVSPDFLDIAYTESGNEAVGASVGVYLHEGVLLSDLKERPAAQIEYFDYFGLPVEND